VANHQKKKKNNGTARQHAIEEDAAEGQEIQIDIDSKRTSMQELERQALVDDEELQAALARQRRQKSRQNIHALRHINGRRVLPPFPLANLFDRIRFTISNLCKFNLYQRGNSCFYDRA